MIVGVYGLGYWIAAYDPARHWPIVLVGLLGKVFGPIGFLLALVDQRLPWTFGLVNVTNDLIWWIPFAAALYYAWRTNSVPAGSLAPLSFDEALHSVRSQQGRTLSELSAKQPLLLLFIRHVGCTFCREALADLAAQRSQLEAAGLKLAVVHMSPPANANALLGRYGLGDLDQFSDQGCRLFRAFELQRGTLWQVLGPTVWRRGLLALLRHGIGKPEGDGFQLAGVFLLRNNKILDSFRHTSSADRADYLALAKAA
jgi:peroxiredoxin